MPCFEYLAQASVPAAQVELETPYMKVCILATIELALKYDWTLPGLELKHLQGLFLRHKYVTL